MSRDLLKISNESLLSKDSDKVSELLEESLKRFSEIQKLDPNAKLTFQRGKTVTQFQYDNHNYLLREIEHKGGCEFYRSNYNLLTNPQKRDEDVIKLLNEGKTQKEVADIVGVSQSTISGIKNKVLKSK